MESLITIELRGKESPFFVTLLALCLKEGAKGIALESADFATERLFMRARAEVSQTGALVNNVAGFTSALWELTYNKKVLANLKIISQDDSQELSLSVPNNKDLESLFAQLINTDVGALERISSGAFVPTQVLVQKVNSQLLACFPGLDVTTPVQSSVEPEIKSSTAIKVIFFVFFVIILTPALFFLWKLLCGVTE